MLGRPGTTEDYVVRADAHIENSPRSIMVYKWIDKEKVKAFCQADGFLYINYTVKAVSINEIRGQMVKALESEVYVIPDTH